jgi:hypothetical protein
MYQGHRGAELSAAGRHAGCRPGKHQLAHARPERTNFDQLPAVRHSALPFLPFVAPHVCLAARTRWAGTHTLLLAYVTRCPTRRLKKQGEVGHCRRRKI